MNLSKTFKLATALPLALLMVAATPANAVVGNWSLDPNLSTSVNVVGSCIAYQEDPQPGGGGDQNSSFARQSICILPNRSNGGWAVVCLVDEQSGHAQGSGTAFAIRHETCYGVVDGYQICMKSTYTEFNDGGWIGSTADESGCLYEFIQH